MSSSRADTIVGLSTPASGSLRHIIRTSGPDTVEILSGLLSGDDASFLNERNFHWRKVDLQLSEPQPVAVSCSLFIMKEPRSYTTEDVAEVHVPGSTPLAEMLIDAFRHRGARLAEPGEFTQRAFLNGRIDLAQAEAVLSIIEAQDQNERDVAVEQLQGKLSRKIREMRDRLQHLCAYVESALDFADQDIDVIGREEIQTYLRPVLERVRHVLKRARGRKNITEDPIAALYGRPNAGKSSLFNQLVEEDRAIVTEIAGTTRDTIEGTVVLGDQTVRLLDTAGVEGESSRTADSRDEDLQRKMEEKTKKAAERADILLHTVEPSVLEDRSSFPVLPETVREGTVRIRILTKSDLMDAEKIRKLVESEEFDESPDVVTSVHETRGIDQLRRKIDEKAGNVVGESGKFRLNMRHLSHLEEAEEHLSRALEATGDGIPYEFIAADLREGLRSLGKIVGEVGIEDILDTIFGEFCIGK